MTRLALAVAVVGALGGHALADPALDWMLNCRGCHGAEGVGVPGSVPRLAGEVARFLRVDGGREFLVRVPGVAQSELDDARLAALLDWMVAEFGPAADAAAAVPYAPSEVARLRADPLVDVDAVRALLLRRLEAVP